MRKLLLLLTVSIQATSFAQDIIANSNLEWVTVHITAKEKSNNSPSHGIKGYLSIPGTIFTLSVAVSDSAGNLDFLIKKPLASASMVFQSDDPNTRLVAGQDGPMIKKFPLAPLNFTSTELTDTLPFYGSPDKRYLLDDYTRFSTIEEILIEYVREVKLKKQGGKYNFEVLNTPFQTFFSSAPLVLLDGVPVFDVDKIMSLDPLRLMKIEVVARKYYFGPIAWNGIVSFTSYDGALAGYNLPPGALISEYKAP